MVWKLDISHSEITFSVKHMMISRVTGTFTSFKATLEIEENHPKRCWVEAAVEAASITTRNEQRDAHLRSSDFLEVEHYPLITFKSKKIEHRGKTLYRVWGDLSLHGRTKEVIFTVEYAGQIGKDPGGYQRAGLSAGTTINRKDFGLIWNMALETGGVLVGEAIRIETNLEAIREYET
jgi:polyisoprenoid-binding protein YceI